jgi:hypothetical protein
MKLVQNLYLGRNGIIKNKCSSSACTKDLQKIMDHEQVSKYFRKLITSTSCPTDGITTFPLPCAACLTLVPTKKNAAVSITGGGDAALTKSCLFLLGGTLDFFV